MKKIKRTAALFLSMLMLVSMFTVCGIFSSALSNVIQIGYIYYDFSSLSGVTGFSSAFVTGCDGSASGDIEILDTVNGCPVTSVDADVFYNLRNITSIKFPDSIDELGSGVCYNCSSLESVYLPVGLKHIPIYGFKSCVSLKEIVIPEGVEYIGDNAFSNCTSLTDITISSSVTEIETAAFAECTGLIDVYYIGTKEEWNSILILEENECLLNANVHFLGHDAEYKNTVIGENDIALKFKDGTFPENVNVSLVANEMTDGDAFVALREQKNNNKAQIFDIVITDENGNKIQPNGEVLVRIPLPDGFQRDATAIYYISSDGRLEKLDSYYDSGYIYFKTTHFSAYAVVEEIPEDNDDNNHHGNGDWSVFSLIKKGWELLKKIFEFIKSLFNT